MHIELDHFIRQLIGTVLATLLPLVLLVFLHMPEHLAPAAGGLNTPVVQPAQNQGA